MKVDINLDDLHAKFNGANYIRAKRAVANQFAISAQPFIPEQSSHLMNWRTIANDGSSIIYIVPYAHRQFTAPTDPAWHYTKAGSGPHWDQRVKALYMPELVKAFLVGGGFIG